MRATSPARFQRSGWAGRKHSGILVWYNAFLRNILSRGENQEASSQGNNHARICIESFRSN